MSEYPTSQCRLPDTWLLLQHFQFIDIRPPLTLALHIDEALLLQFLDVVVGSLPGDANVIGEALLSGKAIVVRPRVTEQRRVSHLGAHRDLLRSKHTVGYLCEPILGKGIRSFEDDRLLSEVFANWR